MEKYISDIFETDNGKFGIEWEWEDGGRTRDFFNTEEERAKVLKEFEEENSIFYKL